MKRLFILMLVAVAAVALFGGLVYAVLVVANRSEPAANTVYGATPQRMWATAAVVLGLVGVVIGALALIRPASRFATAPARFAVLLAGLIAVVNGWLVLTVATGGPGTGNGVVGGAGAVILGLLATALGGLALVRSRQHTRLA